MLTRLSAWRERRRLRKLGPVDVRESVRFAERRQNDAMAGYVVVVERAATWITAGRPLPKVRGGLWRTDRAL